MKVIKSHKQSDLLGISSSLLCLIHCLVFPLFFIWYSTYAVDAWHLLDYLFIFLAGIAVYFSSKNNPLALLRAGFWLSYFIFTASLLLHETFTFAFYASLIASLALVFLHVVNFTMHLRQHHPYASTH